MSAFLLTAIGENELMNQGSNELMTQYFQQAILEGIIFSRSAQNDCVVVFQLCNIIKMIRALIC